MKHTFNVTLALILIFVIAQITGIAIINQYMDYEKTVETGNATYSSLPFEMERPDIEQSYSYIFILIGVFVGTLIILALIKFKQMGLWKVWYFLAVLLSLTVAFAAFISSWLALAFAIIMAVFKIWKPNIIVHNLSEIIIYGGLAAIFVPIMNMFSVVMLLIIISFYDMYAVWKSKHMIKMAKFQTESKLFAGLSIPYTRTDENEKIFLRKVEIKPEKKMTSKSSKENSKTAKKESSQIAILGGGDIAFPILFTGVVMKSLIVDGFSRTSAFLHVMIITFFVTVALALLLFSSKKGRFYPAMPFISLGCFIGYGVLILILKMSF
jgi:presenilin-like A22 family membrane protease